MKTEEESRAYQREYRASHHNQCLERERAYKKAHHDKILQLERDRYQRDPEKKRAQSAANLQRHPEVKRASNKAYYRLHPENGIAKAEKRRALKYTNTPIAELLTEAQWRDILDQYHHRCAYCGRKMDKLTMDHVIPLSKGGKHSANNVVPACGHCNFSKRARTPEERFGLVVANG